MFDSDCINKGANNLVHININVQYFVLWTMNSDLKVHTCSDQPGPGARYVAFKVMRPIRTTLEI